MSSAVNTDKRRNFSLFSPNGSLVVIFFATTDKQTYLTLLALTVVIESMSSGETNESSGLVRLAPELMHKVALSGYLSFNDVAALSQTCRRMKAIFVEDGYGRDIHYALKGVVENVRTKRWRSARYAVRRKWFVEGEEEEGSVWKGVAEAVVGEEKVVLEDGDEEDLAGWESVFLAASSLPEASGWTTTWTSNKDGSPMSLLHSAAAAGSEKILNLVLEKDAGADLEVRNVWGETPLFTACEAGRGGAAKVLVERGANVMVISQRDESVLHVASKSGNAELVQYLLRTGVVVDWVDNAGDTALGKACERGHADVVRVLVREGEAEINKAGRMGWTPLHLACRCDKEEWKDVVQVLLEAGADVGIVDDDGVFPFDLARREGRDGIDELLGSLGGEGGLVGLAPELMHMVALSGWLTFENVCALALSCKTMKSIFVDDAYGRDIHYALKGVVENVRTKRWRSARYAMGRRWFVDGKGEEESDLWRSVVECGWDFCATRSWSKEDWDELEAVILAVVSLPGAVPGAGGWTEAWFCQIRGLTERTSLLHVGARMRSEKVVDWVLQRGGSLEERDGSRGMGDTPLLVACWVGHLGIVQRLVEAGADVSVKNESELGVLLPACSSGNVELVRYVLNREGLDHGSDVGEALVWACQGGDLEIVRMLMELTPDAEKHKDGCVWVRALVAAAEEGHAHVVRELVEKGVNVDALEVSWSRTAPRTALCCACERGHVQVVRVLVEEGRADVHQVGKDGRTPLFWACWSGASDAVNVLLEAGADAGIVGPRGKTVLDVARWMGHDAVVAVLLEHRGGTRGGMERVESGGEGAGQDDVVVGGGGDEGGLVGLAPELIHLVALSGWLAFEDVCALALSLVGVGGRWCARRQRVTMPTTRCRSRSSEWTWRTGRSRVASCGDSSALGKVLPRRR